MYGGMEHSGLLRGYVKREWGDAGCESSNGAVARSPAFDKLHLKLVDLLSSEGCNVIRIVVCDEYLTHHLANLLCMPLAQALNLASKRTNL